MKGDIFQSWYVFALKSIIKTQTIMATVRKMKLGSQGLEVSAQGLGCSGLTDGYGPTKTEADMIGLIHHAVHRGITFLDTSDIYGAFANEILLGKVCSFTQFS